MFSRAIVLVGVSCASFGVGMLAVRRVLSVVLVGFCGVLPACSGSCYIGGREGVFVADMQGRDWFDRRLSIQSLTLGDRPVATDGSCWLTDLAGRQPLEASCTQWSGDSCSIFGILGEDRSGGDGIDVFFVVSGSSQESCGLGLAFLRRTDEWPALGFCMPSSADIAVGYGSGGRLSIGGSCVFPGARSGMPDVLLRFQGSWCLADSAAPPMMDQAVEAALSQFVSELAGRR